MEEVGVFNAAYTYAHYGKMAFPIYGLQFFDSFGIHPHLHYAILGLLIRAGADLYLAEAIPILVVSVIATWLILIGKFPETVKLGFLLGLYGTVVLSVMYLPDDAVGVRPELHLSIAWFAGLVALESARRERWLLWKLCLGTLLVSFAAALQNYALLAPLGLVVYAVWLVRSTPRREAARKIAFCLVFACLVGVPFLILYAYPNADMIRANISWGTGHSSPIGAKLSAYLNTYAGLMPRFRSDLRSSFFAIAPVLGALLLKLPLFVIAVALLLLRSSTRGLALAAIPMPFVAAWLRPESQYFISEQIICLAGFWAALFGGILYLAQKTGLGKKPLQWILAAACFALVVTGSPPLREIRSVTQSPLHEMDVARAATRKLVGPHATVASRHLAWYLSGGSEWYRLESDITEPASLDDFDARLYGSQFDAIADYLMYSDQSQNGITPSSMYANGALGLKGFFLTQRMRGLSLLLFQAGPGPVAGYYLRNDQLYRFDEDESGSWMFVTVVGRRDRPPRIAGDIGEADVLALPGGPPQMAISALLLPRVADPAKESAWGTGLKTLSVVPGRVTKVDAYALVRESRAEDKPIRFLRTPEEDVLTSFLADAKHPVSTADHCRAEELRPAETLTPLSSGKYANGFEAANAFDDRDSSWGSERLGPLTRLVSYIGADFGADRRVAIRAVSLQHTPDPGSSIGSAVLMTADTRYDWRPVAVLTLAKDAATHVYCISPSGEHRFWKLVAADNPRFNYAWQVVTLRFYQ